MQQGWGPRHSIARDAAVPGRPDLLELGMQQGGGRRTLRSRGCSRAGGPWPSEPEVQRVGVNPLRAAPQLTAGMPAAAPGAPLAALLLQTEL